MASLHHWHAYQSILVALAPDDDTDTAAVLKRLELTSSKVGCHVPPQCVHRFEIGVACQYVTVSWLTTVPFLLRSWWQGLSKAIDRRRSLFGDGDNDGDDDEMVFKKEKKQRYDSFLLQHAILEFWDSKTQVQKRLLHLVT